MADDAASLLLINPHSRRGRQFRREALAHLAGLGLQVVLPDPDLEFDIDQLIRRYAGQVRRVIIGGGDGSLNRAAGALLATGLPLGILPLGTANDLARTLEIPVSLPQACRIIARGHRQAIDLGQVNSRYFFNVASLGLSVRVTRKLSPDSKRRWGVFSYALAALRAVIRLRRLRATIRIGEQVRQVRTVQIAIGNGRHYGGGLAIAHNARIDDGRLDLYSLEVRRRRELLWLLPGLLQGRLPSSFTASCGPDEYIEIRTRRPHRISCDGEILSRTPARFRVLPGVIQVYVP